MSTRTDRPPTRRQTDLRPRLPDRIRQFWVDRRRGGRLPRNLRRLLAVALALTAGLLLLIPPEPVDGAPVVVLRRDLPIGAVLQHGDLDVVLRADPPDGAPSDSAEVAGRTLAAAVRRGEVLTDVRLVEPAGPSPGPGRVAVPIRPADPAVTGLLRPGMRVALVSVGPDGSAIPLVAEAVVLVVGDSDGSAGQRPVVLAVPVDNADQVVAAALAGTVALRFV